MTYFYNMKKNNGLLLLPFLYSLWLLFSCSSCTNAKKLTVMGDLSPNETIGGWPRQAPVYHIKAKDNLYVGISTQDQDLNKVTDPTSMGAQPGMGYESSPARAVNGNMVDADGNITLPLLGKVPVAGMTIAQAEDTIRAIAKEYLKDAIIKVRLLNYKLTILGEVKMPGVYYNYNNYVTIFDAISVAQGTTDYAKLADVLVLRPTPRGTKTYSLNLNSKSALMSEGYYLLPDDVVVLQPGKNKGLQQKLPMVGIVVGSLSALLLLLNYLK
jgi:polysaccharide export outer membrane protein